MNVKTPHYFLITVLFLMSSALGAQTTISGTVTDAETGEPLPGVNVRIQRTYSGTAAGVDGSFQFTIEKDPPFILEFSFIGYRSLELQIDRSEDASGLRIAMTSQPLNTNEVIVTAELREEIVQKIPMSVAVIDERLVSRSRVIDDPGDLVDYVPGFSGKNYSSNGSLYTVRGINTSGAGSISYEAGVAIFHDGLYNARSTAAGRNFFDIDRVEIVKGPQSTLVGRHAVAGVISIYSKNPKFYKELSVQTAIGNWGQKEITYQFNYPLSNKLAMRIAGVRRYRDGVLEITNLDDETGKIDITGNRLSLLWQPASELNFSLKLEHMYTRGGGLPNKSINPLTGGNPDRFAREYQLDFNPEDINEYFSAALNGNWVLNDRLALKSITGYNHNNQDPFNADLDGSPTHILRLFNPNSFSNFIQEFRLTGETDRLNWFAAASFFDEDARMVVEASLNDFVIIPALLGPAGVPLDFCVDNPACLMDAREISDNNSDNRNYSLFGNARYALSERLDVSFGLRFSFDEKGLITESELGEGAIHSLLGTNIQGPPGDNKNEDSWFSVQPRLALDYDFNENMMIYGTYSHGFKAGGFNLYTASAFEEETNNAFEAGFKSSLAQERIKLNLTGYYMFFQNKQEAFVQNNIIEINNAAEVISRGVELESSFNWPKNFTLIANAGLNFAEYKDFEIPAPNNPDSTLDFSGNTPRTSPRTQLSVIAQYVLPVRKLGDIVLRTDLTYQSQEFYNRNNNEVQLMEGYSLFNAYLGVEQLFNGRVDLAFFATNITDTNYLVDSRQDFTNTPTGFVVTPGLPRLYGVKLKLNNIFEW